MNELNLLTGIDGKQRREHITDLIGDINALRIMITRLENQVLRNEAMVESLLAMRPIDEKQPSQSAPTVVDKTVVDKTTAQCVHDLAEHWGKPFSSGDMVKAISRPYDTQAIYAALYAIKRKGLLERNSDGLWIKPVNK